MRGARLGFSSAASALGLAARVRFGFSSAVGLSAFGFWARFGRVFGFSSAVSTASVVSATSGFLRAARRGFDSAGASGAVVAASGVRASGSALPSGCASLIVMWHVRLRIRATRPRARARQRLSVGPAPMYAAETTISSPARPWFISAFATAEFRTFSRSRAASRVMNARIVRASGTVRPRI